MNDFIKHINNPEPAIIRAREAGRAASGELLRTECPHPVSAIDMVVDDDSGVNRNARPTNLFICSICNHKLRLVDFYGTEARDG